MQELDWRVFKERQEQVMHFVEHCMVEGLHYGQVIGDKPSLLKPGGELLVQWFGLESQMSLVERVMDWSGGAEGVGEPVFYYRYRHELFLDGKRVGDGYGSANSREPKYRYRWLDAIPPGMDPALCETRKTQVEEFEFAYNKRETTGQWGKPDVYWEAFDRAIEDGTVVRFQKKKRDKTTTEGLRVVTIKYRIPNPDIFDYINTVEKMSQKRAFMAAVMMACSVSQFFTQDVEDISDMGGVQEWRPTWHLFYNRVIPAIPNLLKGCGTDAEMVNVIRNMYKDKYGVEGWDPSLATECQAYLIQLNEEATTIEDKPIEMTPKDAFRWLVKLATEKADERQSEALAHAIEQLDPTDESGEDSPLWRESFDLLGKELIVFGLEGIEMPKMLPEGAE